MELGERSEKNTAEERRREHGTLSLDDRKKLLCDGVSGILSFSEEEFVLATSLGKLSGAGEGLFVESLDRAAGKIVITGRINALWYQGEEKEKSAAFSLFGRKAR